MKAMLGVDGIKGDIQRRVLILERTRDKKITDVSETHDAINGFYHAAE